MKGRDKLTLDNKTLALKSLEALYNFKIQRRIHNGYKEWDRARIRIANKEIPALRQLFGKWQYIYSSNLGRISLIQLTDEYYAHTPWEIHCLTGNLFEDIERFPNKKKAIKRIRELLLEEK